MKQQALPVYLTPQETQRLIDACANERDKWLVRFLCYTGARVTEAINFRLSDMTDTGVLLLNEKQRGRAQKHVMLPATFLEELRSFAKGRPTDQPLFGRLVDGRPLCRQQAWRIVKRAGTVAGVFKRSFVDGTLRTPWPHALRHTSAVRQLQAGVPITGVQRQLGHASLASTAVYTQLADPDLQRMVQAVKF